MGKFDFDVIWTALPYLFQTGMTFTLTLTVLAAVMGLALGTLLAMMRLSRFKILSVPAGIYVNVMRSIPLLLVIFWFYFLVPYIAAWVVGSPTPLRVGAFNSAVITFTMFEAAYFCEIMRAGIQSIARGQVSASMAIGLSPWQGMRYVVLPQAFRNMVPALLTRVIILFQDTSLVYAIGAYDMLKGFEVAGKNFGRPIEAYLAAAVLYFVMCYSLSWMVKRLHQKIAIIR
jgi:glutamate/aspartate transport system permease protein